MAKLRTFNLTKKKYLFLSVLILPIALIFNVLVVFVLLLNPRSWKFNKAEAAMLLDRELIPFEQLSYQECLNHVEQDSVVNKSVKGDSGADYQIDIQMIWDSCADGPIRVIGSIDDGRLRAYIPFSKSFIVNPQGGITT